MKLAYSTNGFGQVTLPEAVRQIAAHGYAAVELLADEPHWTPGAGPVERAAVRGALSETGLGISNVNANTAMSLWPVPPPETVFEPALSHRDPAVRARRIGYTLAAMDFAAELGASTLSVTSGRAAADVPPEEGTRWFAESLARLAEEAASRGLRLGVEYEPGLLVETSHEVQALIERVDHPALGANLDIGHAICAGEDPYAAIERLAGRIWNVHLEDIRGRKHYHLVPGEGDVDFDAVIAALGATGYTGCLTVELYTCSHRADAAAAAAFAALAPRLAAYLGGRGRGLPS